MRWYKIVCGGSTWDATGDPYALDVQMDISLAAADTPINGSMVKISGVGLQAITAVNQFFGQQIQVYGGMQKGLPLANQQSAYAGLLASGVVTQPYGVYQGLDQAIGLVFTPGAPANKVPGPAPTPPNDHYVLDWKKGTPLGPALQKMFGAANPLAQTATVNIQANIVATEDQPGYFQNLYQVADFVRKWSKQIIGGQYEGVNVVVNPDQSISVFDGAQGGNTQLLTTDLVGQPTWIDVAKIQVRTVMRADIHVGATITLPAQTIVSSVAVPVGPGSLQQWALSGTLRVVTVRHVGAFRQPSGDSWITIIEAMPTGPAPTG